ncbi:hypothetical protein [Microbacterium sp. 18062]|uniref:hypothetical protein n=1 Tax=Microbacterium sp. 18062 TaxID=2681410 RepID=UPI00135BF1E6|nr:hypothetical protein [Microbacterium sp. 18062]
MSTHDEHGSGRAHDDHEACAAADGARCANCRAGRMLTARRVSAAMDEVLGSLPLLERPAAVTANAVARITQIGVYAAPSRPGEPIHWAEGRTTLRLHADAVVAAFLTEPAGQGDGPPALRLVGPGDAPAHQCHALLDADRLALDGLARAPEEEGAPRTAVVPPLPVPVDDGSDQLGRIDALLTRPRAPYVPHRHIDPDVLPALFEHACAVGLALGAAVLSGCAFHGTQGDLHSVARMEGITTVTMTDATVELDLAAVSSCLLVRSHAAHGPTSALELYDGEHRCVAMISQFGLVDAGVHAAWEELTESLPDVA